MLHIPKQDDTLVSQRQSNRSRIWLIPGYDIHERIGSGGTSVVYRGTSASDPEAEFAIKILSRTIHERGSLFRFNRETQALEKLAHPNIARLHASGITEDDHPYLVIEFIHGIRIDKYCDQHALTIDERVRLLLPICHALQHAHDQGMIHRDLKPDNILVNQEGIPFLTDFGLSKSIEESESHSEKTCAGAILGTLNYLSPEQLFALKNHVSRETDVFGIGAVLHVLLTGNPPLDFENIVEAATEYFGRLPIEIDSIHTIPQSLEAICIQCLSPDPGARYATVHDLAKDLERFLDGKSVSAKHQKMVRRVSVIARQHPLLFRTSIAAFFVAVFASVVFFGLWQSSERSFVKADQKVRDLQQALIAFSDYVRSLEDSPDTMLDQRDLLQIISDRYADFEEEFDSDANLLFNAARNDFKLARLEQHIGNNDSRVKYFRHAESKFRRLLDNVPDHEEGRFGLFHTLISVTKHELALEEIKLLEQLFPSNLDYTDAVCATTLQIASSRIAKGRYEEAQHLVDIGAAYASRLQKFAVAFPRFRRKRVSALEQQARLAIARGDLDSGIRLIQESIAEYEFIDTLGCDVGSEAIEHMYTLEFAFGIAAILGDLEDAKELKAKSDEVYRDAQETYATFIDVYWRRCHSLNEHAAFYALNSMENELSAVRDQWRSVLTQWESNAVMNEDYWYCMVAFYSSPFFDHDDIDRLAEAARHLPPQQAFPQGMALLRMGEYDSAANMFEESASRFSKHERPAIYFQLANRLAFDDPIDNLVPMVLLSEKLRIFAMTRSFAEAEFGESIRLEVEMHHRNLERLGARRN